MKVKSIILAVLLGSTTAIAQVPSYVPVNGLKGWYPFTGNANDQSSNGYNGTVNGATLSSDRYSATNTAYLFDGTNDTIKTTYVQQNITSFTVSAWFKTSVGGPILSGDQTSNCITLAIGKQPYDGINTGKITFRADGPAIAIGQMSTNTYLDNNWHHVVGVYSGSAGNISDSQFKIYVDNILVSSTPITTGNVSAPLNDIRPVIIGAHYNWSTAIFNGSLDDIGVWNRALTTIEIAKLYNSCSLSTQITNNSITATTISNVQISTTTNGTGVTYNWQSNASNLGWVNIPTNTTYTGVSTNTLNINSIKLGNHNQHFRVLSAGGNCLDTSNIATLNIADTCIITNHIVVNDTIFTHVTITDTLKIGVHFLGLNSIPEVAIVNVYPNPTNDIINIFTGDFANISTNTVRIVNSNGQTVFSSLLSQQLFQISTTSFGARGVYTIEILDSNQVIKQTRKIVLQ